MKKLISMLLAIVLIMGCVGINVFATETQFTDVPSDAYYYDAVSWAVENDITKGTGDNKFSPSDGCTRGQVVTFLWRTEDSPEPMNTDAGFQDLKANAYYTDAVAWAVENEITKGTGTNTFSPDATCTRGQIVTFLWRAKGSPEFLNADTGFSDVKSNAFYANAVKWAVENGITQGTGDNKFSPNATCTRGQVVTFLYRAMVGSDIELEHKHEWVFSEYVGPYACQEGYNVYTCECGEAYKQGTGDVLECRWEAIEVVPPTTEEMGYTVYKCAVCGNTWTDYDKEKLPAETEPVETEPAPGEHEGNCAWEIIEVVEPTAEKMGYKIYKCSICGNTMTVNNCGHHEASAEVLASVTVSRYWYNASCHCDYSTLYGADTRDGAIALVHAHIAEHGGKSATHYISAIIGFEIYDYPVFFDCIHCGATCAYTDCYEWNDYFSKEYFDYATAP